MKKDYLNPKMKWEWIPKIPLHSHIDQTIAATEVEIAAPFTLDDLIEYEATNEKDEPIKKRD